ncbi:MAG: hypothetical protein IJP84_11250 [Lachnospiraceae bacterium]|nr:hypothetical protein [Lachnospiraceae bacterium]
MSDYLNLNRFIFNDECPDFTAEEVLSGLGLPTEVIEKGDYRQEFDAIKKEARELIRMTAGAVYFKMPDSSVPPVPSGPGVVGVILTLGTAVTGRSDEYLAQGEYRKSMILNEISDFCLITYEEMIRERLIVLSKRKGMGLLRMYEGQDIPVSELQYVWNALMADKNLGVHITRESTLYPVKTSCFIMKVQDDGEL